MRTSTSSAEAWPAGTRCRLEMLADNEVVVHSIDTEFGEVVTIKHAMLAFWPSSIVESPTKKNVETLSILPIFQNAILYHAGSVEF